MKTINLTKIKKLDPCKHRLDNYIEHYKNRNFTIEQFLRLKKISHEDKLWVAFRMMPKKNLRFAAGEIALSVLSIFEKEFPKDSRPRKAIELAMSEKVDREAVKKAANDAYTAHAARADAADSAAAYYAARAARAAYYAARAAYDAYDAAYSVYNAAYTADATCATYDAFYYAAETDNSKKQEKLQIDIVRKYWR